MTLSVKVEKDVSTPGVSAVLGGTAVPGVRAFGAIAPLTWRHCGIKNVHEESRIHELIPVRTRSGTSTPRANRSTVSRESPVSVVILAQEYRGKNRKTTKGRERLSVLDRSRYGNRPFSGEGVIFDPPQVEDPYIPTTWTPGVTRT